MMVGNTDTRFYLDLTSCVYRYVPVLLGAADVPMIHGHDERVSSTAMGKAAEFYYHIISVADRQPKIPVSKSSRADGEL